MSFEGRRLMVDSCVWVDSFCLDHVNGEDAKAFLLEAQRQGAELLYPVHAAKDVLYVLEHEFKRAARKADERPSEPVMLAAREAALGCMHAMVEAATAVGADASDIWLANKYLGIHRDFEDNLVLAACQRARADYLVTQDRDLMAHANVAAKTPKDMLNLMLLGI